MTIHRVGGHGSTGSGPESSSGGFESLEARTQFGKLLDVVGQPGSAVKIEQPTLRGRLRQDPPGVYHFRVTQDDWPNDTVTFSASTSRDGRFVERLTFEKNGLVVTPSQPVAGDIFFGRVVQPLYKFLFGEQGQ